MSLKVVVMKCSRMKMIGWCCSNYNTITTSSLHLFSFQYLCILLHDSLCHAASNTQRHAYVFICGNSVNSCMEFITWNCQPKEKHVSISETRKHKKTPKVYLYLQEKDVNFTRRRLDGKFTMCRPSRQDTNLLLSLSCHQLLLQPWLLENDSYDTHEYQHSQYKIITFILTPLYLPQTSLLSS